MLRRMIIIIGCLIKNLVCLVIKGFVDNHFYIINANNKTYITGCYAFKITIKTI